MNEIKNSHRYYIIDLRYHLDEIHHRDLVLSISLDDNNIKVWDINNLECLLSLDNIYKKKSLITACFYKSKKQNYIITGISNDYDPIRMINLDNLRTQKLLDSKDKIYFIDFYYDKNSSKNYIITGNLGYVKSYDFKKRKLYHKYSDKDSGTHLSVLVNDNDKLLKLIEYCFDGKIRLWDFHTGILISQIKVNKWLTGLCILNSDNLFVGCYDRTIKLIDLKNKNVIKSFEGHKDWVLTINKINHPKYGTCLISQGRRNDQIKMWMIEP
jgi:WD40 repeat protein